jgi:hypothetical protein
MHRELYGRPTRCIISLKSLNELITLLTSVVKRRSVLRTQEIICNQMVSMISYVNGGTKVDPVSLLRLALSHYRNFGKISEHAFEIVPYYHP